MNHSYVLVIAMVLLAACTPASNSVKAAVSSAPGWEWCLDGYEYNSDSVQASTDYKIEAKVSFKGREYCRAHSVSTIAIGSDTMTVVTDNYYLKDGSESWIVSTTTSPYLDEPQVSEIHYRNGEVVTS